ncbi:MAG: SpoIID/LytB domain-containing protein, partial [Oscillospiraceae bacterium]
MKNKILLLLLFAVLIVVTPMLALVGKSYDAGTKPQVKDSEKKGEKIFEGGEIIVFDEANGKILTLTEREYVLGATLCEMPASYEPEALKAQAVACHTYALFVKKMRQSSPDPNLKSAYFTVNSSMLEGYMSIDRAKSYFKDSFSEYYSKVSAA